jgi:hypothetical protein
MDLPPQRFSSYLKMLFVTAIFLPEFGEPHKSLEIYLQHGRSLVASGVPLRVYTSPALEEILLKDWRGMATDHVDIRVDVPPDPFWEFQVCLPPRRNISKDTAFFLSVQLSKLKFCALAGESSDFVVWVDFGLFHVIKDLEAGKEHLRALATLLPQSGRTRLLSPSNWPQDQYFSWHAPCWRHLGGVLMGPGSAFAKAYDKQQRLVVAFLPILTWEVNYWALMDDFDSYPADHDDTILANALKIL